MNLKDYGFMPNMMHNGTGGIPARITAVHRDRYEAVCEHGEVYARLKTKEYYIWNEDFPTVGDFVLIDHIQNGDSLIIKTLPRRTFFSRREPSSKPKEQAIAANFDYVFIVQSMNQDFNIKRLERYLTLSWQSGALPIIVLTKADLTDNYAKQIETAQNIAADVEVYAVSSKSGLGLKELDKYIQQGKTSVFLGSSGVGKSSLINALAGEEIMAVKEIRENDDKGRHTTTHRQLLVLKNGAMVIDTPGMRELGMWNVSQGLGSAFEDVEQFLGKCKFRDCKHLTEPNCAIKAAIESGALSAERWASYTSLRVEARYTDNRAAYLHTKQKRNKSIKVNERKRNKGRYDD